MIKSFIDKYNLEYLQDKSLEKYNTYRLDVKADYIVFPRDIIELVELLKFVRENKLKYIILGNGSNVIFKNSRYEGIVIVLNKFKYKEIVENNVIVGAGYSLMELALEMSELGLAGLEFASGIPGLVGASVAMNAGAYNSAMADVVRSVLVLTPELEVEMMMKEQLEFSYRDSYFKKHKDYIILEVTMELVETSDKEAMLETIETRRKRRLETQPIGMPSAGSVFRNPTGMYAGELIEKCGFKGYVYNGVEVSSKHANFIVNKGGATGQDIVLVIEKIVKKVKEEFGVDLVLEQEIVE